MLLILCFNKFFQVEIISLKLKFINHFLLILILYFFKFFVLNKISFSLIKSSLLNLFEVILGKKFQCKLHFLFILELFNDIIFESCKGNFFQIITHYLI